MIISVNDGLTPYIGENGNWFIGDTDTGILAKGQSATNIETIILPASDWSGLSQTVVCTGILADETKQVVTIFPTPASRDEYMDSGIICTSVGVNSLTFTADVSPASDLIVYVAIEEAGQAPREVYSTEERVVGTWIDGKPIYRIVMLSTTPSAINTIQTVTGSWSNLESLVDVKGYVDGSVSYSTIRRPITDTSTFVVWLTRTSLNMKVAVADYISRPFYLVVEYTKITDTATIAIPTAAAMAAAYEEGVNNI